MIKYDPKADLYKLLGLRANASSEQIKRAHRHAIRTAHPDKSTGDKDRAALLNHARDVLLDDTSRREYDSGRSAFLAAKKAKRSAKKRPPVHARYGAKAKASSKAHAQTAPSAAQEAASTAVQTIEMKKIVEEAFKNVHRHVERREYGWALFWGVVGVYAGIGKPEAA